MKGPSCTLCGSPHWSYEPHDLKDVAPRGMVREFLSVAPRVEVGKYPARDSGQPSEITDKPDKITDTHCQICNRPVAPSKTRPRRFCSDACRKRASRT